ncbi:MAG: zinc-binding alcohol dehydrogenase, partial [Actinomycetota bacterium]|nr:zinc-binding alcohol dehydrogenase [Actinomycetota bacterium]
MRNEGVVRALSIDGPGAASIVAWPEESMGEGCFRADTLYTGLSAGTELTYYKGTNPYLFASWDKRLGIFSRRDPASGYPITAPGYMEVGRVRESDTPAIAIGEMVAMGYGHKTSHVADPVDDYFVPFPADLDPILGIYVAHMGPICANGLLHAAADVIGHGVLGLGDGVRGRDVVITGAGVVGLMLGLFATHHGAASVAVVDRTPARLAAAEGLGLLPIDEREGDVAQSVKERLRHGTADRGADVVFQCRAQISSLVIALRSLRPQGSVIDLAFYQGGANELRLGEEFHHNGLSIRCAQIARVPRGLAHLWDRRRLAAETIQLLGIYGDAIRKHII